MEAQFGGRLGPISCFLKVLPFPSSGRGSVMTTHVHFLSGTIWMPPFRVVISPPLWLLSPPLQVLPTPVFPPWTGNWAAQHTNGMESQRQAMVSLNCTISATAQGSQHKSRCHCGHEGGNVQFTASVKMIFSNWPFLGYPKRVKSRRITCICLTNIL